MGKMWGKRGGMKNADNDSRTRKCYYTFYWNDDGDYCGNTAFGQSGDIRQCHNLSCDGGFYGQHGAFIWSEYNVPLRNRFG